MSSHLIFSFPTLRSHIFSPLFSSIFSSLLISFPFFLYIQFPSLLSPPLLYCPLFSRPPPSLSFHSRLFLCLLSSPVLLTHSPLSSLSSSPVSSHLSSPLTSFPFRFAPLFLLFSSPSVSFHFPSLPAPPPLPPNLSLLLFPFLFPPQSLLLS